MQAAAYINSPTPPFQSASAHSMAPLLGKTLALSWALPMMMILSMAPSVSSRTRRYTAPTVSRLTDLFPHLSIDQAFNSSFGSSNIQLMGNGSAAYLSLSKSSGSGLASRNKYYYGFFSAAIKLPAGLSSGVVVAFYMSNGETFPHNHDEIDIELLGHDQRNGWVLQTNIYANGSVSTGREEKFYLWFDPTQQQHYYSIIWNSHHIVFLVDNIPVREFPRSGAFSPAYPSKPMSLYATIWDGSEWATHGGKYPVNYKYAPFVVSFSQVEAAGCISDPRQPPPTCTMKSSVSTDPVQGQDFTALSNQQQSAMAWARSKLMFYSYCKDTSRFKVMPAECR